MGRRKKQRDGKLVILLDPAHGGEFKGAEANGFVESDLALETCIALGQMLSGLGCEPVMTRTTNIEVSHKDRRTMALQSDVIFSVHYHAHRIESVSKVEAWSMERNKTATWIAKEVGVKVASSVGLPFLWRNTHKIQLTDIPKPVICLVAGYISNGEVAARLRGGEYMRSVVNGAYDGIVKRFGL